MAKRDKDPLKAGEKIRSQTMDRRGKNTIRNDDEEEINSVLSVEEILEGNEEVESIPGSLKKRKKMLITISRIRYKRLSQSALSKKKCA